MDPVGDVRRVEDGDGRALDRQPRTFSSAIPSHDVGEHASDGGLPSSSGGAVNESLRILVADSNKHPAPASPPISSTSTEPPASSSSDTTTVADKGATSAAAEATSSTPHRTLIETCLHPIFRFYDFLGGPETLRPPKLTHYPYIGAVDRKLHRYIVRVPLIYRLVALIVFMTTWVVVFAYLVRRSIFDASTSSGPPSYIGKVDVPIVVGNEIYRADSYLCASAVHAGAFPASTGGCATLQVVGFHSIFPSTSSNGVTSIPFNSTFPLAYKFIPSNATNCVDLEWYILTFNVVMSVIFVIFFGGGWGEVRRKEVHAVLKNEKVEYNEIFPPSRQARHHLRRKWGGPELVYWVLSCLCYWHISLVSNPRSPVPPVEDIFADFLPTIFVIYTFWRITFRHLLIPMDSMPLERVIWILPLYWVGVMYTDIFAKLPVDQLTITAISRRPGSIVLIVALFVAVFILGCGQLWTLWRMGVLRKYIVGYSALIIAMLILTPLTGLQLRFHHYIFGMFLLPFCAPPTRLSIMYAWILHGVMLDGIARWGMDSILQTLAAVSRGGAVGTQLPTFGPMKNFNSTVTPPFATETVNKTITISWDPIPGDLNDTWFGYQLVVDDVLRYAGPLTNYTLTLVGSAYFGETSSNTPRLGGGGGNATLGARYLSGVPHFFRLAYDGLNGRGDFTKAATLLPGGTGWVPEAAGPS
ncbi:hypothetical protein HDV05_002489 [Chytridiales sp. JEL 0842]|nr:hypothetical protein HDV05_002489 [Chytridiales sp. JEL 0842]